MKIKTLLAAVASLMIANVNADPRLPFVPKGTEADETEANQLKRCF
jgi:hypothetical protein